MLFNVLIAAACASVIPAEFENAGATHFAGTPTTYSMCSTKDAILKIDTLEFTPNPIVKGQNLTLKMTGVNSAPIVQGAKAKVVVKLGPINVLTQEFDLCAEAPSQGLSCPIPAGPVSLSKSFEIPGNTPGGKFTGKFTFTNSDGKEISCVDAILYL